MSQAIYVAGTGQHRGKTLVSLGLAAALRDRGFIVRYMKPVGQRAIPWEESLVDEDVILLHQMDGLTPNVPCASPVTLPHGFTTRFLRGDCDSATLRDRIAQSFAELSDGADLVLVEGTGHAGVGSVVGLCNAAVAALLGARVVIVTPGGIGRPIDEFALNRALFDQHGVRIIGVIANKFHEERREQVEPLLRCWFERQGAPLLGAIPYEPLLTELTLRQIATEIGAKVLCGEEALDQHIRECVIMSTPHQLLELVRPGVLALIPGSRDDLLLTAMTCAHLTHLAPGFIAVCLTDDALPQPSTLQVVCQSGVPVIASPRDTYQVAAEISDLVAKMTPNDEEKIELCKRLVAQHVDLDALLHGALGVEE